MIMSKSFFCLYTSLLRESLFANSPKATDHGRVVRCRCVTFHLKLARVVEAEAAEERAAQYKVHRTEVFTEVFLLAIQNPVDGPRPVVKLSVSV